MSYSAILSPQDYYALKVCEYPLLYAAGSYDESRLRILDHVFNTVGSGICSPADLSGNVTDRERQTAKKWFACDCVFFPANNQSPYEGLYVCDHEKSAYPAVLSWVSSIRRAFYPNAYFACKYSPTIWGHTYGLGDNYALNNLHISKMGAAWVEEAIWFYQQCLPIVKGATGIGFRELLGLPPMDRPVPERTVTAVLARWQDFIRATLDYLQSLR